MEREARNLRRLLWINTGLDVLYVAGGLVLVVTLGAQNPFMAGSGWGVIVQGGFLLIFDLLHALAVPRREAALPAFEIFSGPEHAAFRLEGGQPAALLVHGFGGTPAEMRGLAEALHRQGWTTEALLLPGFGADIATLTERRYAEWVDAVEAAGRALTAAGHAALVAGRLLVGCSTDAGHRQDDPPDRHDRAGAVLVAGKMVDADHRVLRAAVSAHRLPAAAQGRSRRPQTAPGHGQVHARPRLDDPATQAALRDFRVPLSLIDQVRGLSRRMLAAAPEVTAPVLVVQGTRDPVVRTAQTRRLLQRFAGSPAYVEVDAEHDLTLPEKPAWPQVEAAVLAFAQRIRG